MKTTVYFLISSFLILLVSSCTDDNESNYSKVETKLNIDIPLSATLADDSKSGVILAKKEIPFSGSKDNHLSDIINPSSRITNIRSITPVSGSLLSISQLKEGYEISSLQFNWGYKTLDDAEYTMMEPIDLMSMNYNMSAEAFELNFDEIAGLLLSKINTTNIMLRFNLTGSCNNNFNSVCKLQIPVIIETEVVLPRFELF